MAITGGTLSISREAGIILTPLPAGETDISASGQMPDLPPIRIGQATVIYGTANGFLKVVHLCKL